MTAVKWLEVQIKNTPTVENLMNQLDAFIKQAKEMERQQIIEAVEWGNRKGYEEHTLTCIYNEDLKYYNETYKNETETND